MTPERWQAVKAIVQAALARPPAARPAFVAAACAHDTALRAEVESLLAVPDTGELSDAFVAGPAFAVALADVSGGERAAHADDAADAVRVAQALGGGYSVERELGRGGMATVYLARDLRHRRPVAVKVLHPELSAVLGPERFLREIELTASLQHPHILPLFDSGAAGGLLYYVMPYVEGETLRARLVRQRQLAVPEAVRLAREVADALAYAHGRGVVHRDVKPENILLQGRESPHALVADFGIALAVEDAGRARMTRTGLSLGTPQYMAPEQAAGERAVDARADVYALGAVLYEMLAGEPPFTGPTARAVVARALTEPPRPLAAARPSVPPHVEAAVLTALAKLPADRFPSADAFAAALSEAASGHGTQSPGAGLAGVPGTRRGPVAARRTAVLVVVGAAAAAAVAWAAGRARERASARAATTVAGAEGARGPVRFVIDLDSAALGRSGPAIAPDGRAVVYAAEDTNGSRLYVRRVDELAARPLPGTEDAERPFVSADAAWVAFFSHGALRKVRLDGGGPASLVAALPPGAESAGGAWASDGTILYAVGNTVYRVPADGGSPRRTTRVATSLAVGAPHPLPGGRAALVTLEDCCAGRIGVVDLSSGRVREVGAGFSPRYVAGHVVYATLRGELYRRPFDLDRLEPSGSAEQIASGVAYPFGYATFDVAAGALVYRAGGTTSDPSNLKLTLTDRTGRELQTIPARAPWSPHLSADGRRVAYGANAAGRDSSDLWITDLASGTTQRLTTDGNDNGDPRWSPDGKAVAYSVDAADGKDVLLLRLDGGPPRPLTRRPGWQLPDDWSPDGRAVLFTDVTVTRERGVERKDLWVQPVDGSAPRAYVATPAWEGAARASPDGRWVAYMSNETGRNEVYVQSFPAPGRKTIVSTRGGVHPVWSHDGREIYYWQAGQLIVARVGAGRRGEALAVRDRTSLFRAPYFEGVSANYDVSPDGARFVIVVQAERTNRLVVALGALAAKSQRSGAEH
jgi:serine/threonine-protein kinase